MERRVQDRPLASVSVVDMRQEYAEHGPDVILSGRLKNAIAKTARGRAAVADSAESPRAGDGGVLPAMRRHHRVPELQRVAHRAFRRARSPSRPLPLLQLRRCSCPKACPACKGPYLERRGFGTEKVAARNRGAVADGARGAARSRHGAPQRRSGRYSSIDGGRVDRRARRHADDRQGARFSARDARRRHLGRRRARARRLPRRRAHVPAAHAGGRARRARSRSPARRSCRRSIPHHYSIEHACQQDYAAFFAKELGYRQAMRYPPLTAMVNLVVKGADARAALTDAATLAQHLRNNAERRAIQRARAGARAGREAARRVSRADLPEGQPSREHARGGARGARRRARDAPARVRSTSIRCRFCERTAFHEAVEARADVLGRARAAQSRGRRRRLVADAPPLRSRVDDAMGTLLARRGRRTSTSRAGGARWTIHRTPSCCSRRSACCRSALRIPSGC